MSELSYGLVTPARNEAANLERLAACLAGQSLLPRVWVIVENGSTDETPEVAERLARTHHWIHVVTASGRRDTTRAGPIAGAFTAGLAQLVDPPDIVVKLDADVSFDPDHFEQLLQRFADDQSLGLASGTCYELRDDRWQPVFVARDHVRGAVRAYRRACLEDVLPIEERMGWDTIDELRAGLCGWRTRSFADLVFYHHRAVGERDGSRRTWFAQGDLAHHLAYRPSYFLLKTLFRALREPRAAVMLLGFAAATLTRRPRYHDREVREYLRRQQRIRELPRRAREVFGSGAMESDERR